MLVKLLHKNYTNFRSLNVPEDDIECESFTDISTDFFSVYKNEYYPQPYKITENWTIDYLDENLFETHEN